MDDIAYWMGYLQGWLGSPYSFEMSRKTIRLESIWLTAFNLGRMQFLEEKMEMEMAALASFSLGESNV